MIAQKARIDPPPPDDEPPTVLELQATIAMLNAKLAVYEAVPQPGEDHWCVFKRATKISGMKREKLRRRCESGEVEARKVKGQWIVNATHATRRRFEEARLGRSG
ncbi:hypothetical protein UP09_14280 [Bradyrhizobium sp. LTSP885]|uniref:hypothetical protein n=1 Tax=Bradyrhizobium sp. LTSP885 TaxID=1619232 RepID=UPI0005C94320|nr:hypothetical protein [Bradyrhizobium sp. LTSP885]KJC44814.1 hypothetical protein UP09_14280 [Bradyrhizobium sp. LTSP885]